MVTAVFAAVRQQAPVVQQPPGAQQLSSTHSGQQTPPHASQPDAFVVSATSGRADASAKVAATANRLSAITKCFTASSPHQTENRNSKKRTRNVIRDAINSARHKAMTESDCGTAVRAHGRPRGQASAKGAVHQRHPYLVMSRPLDFGIWIGQCRTPAARGPVVSVARRAHSTRKTGRMD